MHQIQWIKRGLVAGMAAFGGLVAEGDAEAAQTAVLASAGHAYYGNESACFSNYNNGVTNICTGNSSVTGGNSRRFVFALPFQSSVSINTSTGIQIDIWNPAPTVWGTQCIVNTWAGNSLIAQSSWVGTTLHGNSTLSITGSYGVPATMGGPIAGEVICDVENGGRIRGVTVNTY